MPLATRLPAGLAGVFPEDNGACGWGSDTCAARALTVPSSFALPSSLTLWRLVAFQPLGLDEPSGKVALRATGEKSWERV